MRQRSGKPPEISKQPVNARTGALCAVTDPAMWSSFDAAITGVARHHLDGVGFCFSPEDPYTGVDLDHCRDADTGELTPWGHELVTLLDSYSEVSPSGSGVHILIKATLPAGAGHKRHYHDGAVEIYSTGRFFTVTGAALDDVPLLILERQAALDQLRQRVWRAGASRTTNTTTNTTASAETAETAQTAALSGSTDTSNPTGPSEELELAPPTCGVTTLSDDEVLAHCRSDASGPHFCAVYDEGDLTDDDSDDSRADFFVWSKLAFYIGNDPARIARLAEGGAHYRRPEDPTEAAARQRKWQRPYPPYGTFQQRQIAVTLAGRGDDQVFGSAVDAHDVVFEFYPADSSDPADSADSFCLPVSSDAEAAWERLPLQPFPTRALPKPLTDFVTAGAAAIGCPPDFIGLPLLSGLGAAIGATRVVEIKSGWQEHPCLWTCLVAEPGDRKSPALKLALAPFERRQRRLQDAYMAERVDYQQRHAQHEVELAEWQARVKKHDRSAGAKPEEPAKPVMRQCFATDATMEALADVLMMF